MLFRIQCSRWRRFSRNARRSNWWSTTNCRISKTAINFWRSSPSKGVYWRREECRMSSKLHGSFFRTGLGKEAWTLSLRFYFFSNIEIVNSIFPLCLFLYTLEFFPQFMPKTDSIFPSIHLLFLDWLIFSQFFFTIFSDSIQTHFKGPFHFSIHHFLFLNIFTRFLETFWWKFRFFQLVLRASFYFSTDFFDESMGFFSVWFFIPFFPFFKFFFYFNFLNLIFFSIFPIYFLILIFFPIFFSLIFYSISRFHLINIENLILFCNFLVFVPG